MAISSTGSAGVAGAAATAAATTSLLPVHPSRTPLEEIIVDSATWVQRRTVVATQFAGQRCSSAFVGMAKNSVAQSGNPFLDEINQRLQTLWLVAKPQPRFHNGLFREVAWLVGHQAYGLRELGIRELGFYGPLTHLILQYVGSEISTEEVMLPPGNEDAPLDLFPKTREERDFRFTLLMGNHNRGWYLPSQVDVQLGPDIDHDSAYTAFDELQVALVTRQVEMNALEVAVTGEENSPAWKAIAKNDAQREGQRQLTQLTAQWADLRSVACFGPREVHKTLWAEMTRQLSNEPRLVMGRVNHEIGLAAIRGAGSYGAHSTIASIVMSYAYPLETAAALNVPRVRELQFDLMVTHLRNDHYLRASDPRGVLKIGPDEVDTPLDQLMVRSLVWQDQCTQVAIGRAGYGCSQWVKAMALDSAREEGEKFWTEITGRVTTLKAYSHPQLTPSSYPGHFKDLAVILGSKPDIVRDMLSESFKSAAIGQIVFSYYFPGEEPLEEEVVPKGVSQGYQRSPFSRLPSLSLNLEERNRCFARIMGAFGAALAKGPSLPGTAAAPGAAAFK